MMNHGMTPFENYMMVHKEGKRANGVGITGLVLGSVGLLAGVTGWIYANSQAKKAQEVATAKSDGLRDLVSTLAGTVAAERAERIAGDINLTNTVNDSVSGSQQGTLTAQQAAELSAVNSVMQQTYSDFVTGRASLNPTPVSLYSSPQPCGCPATGCGCNG